MMKRHMLGSAVVASALLLTGCQAADEATDYDAVGKDEKSAAADDTDAKGHAQELAAAQPRIVTTYDGGIVTLDATTLDVIADTKIEGFNRLNPVGDGRHLVVSVADGFRLFDAGVWTQPHGDHTHSYAADPELTDTVFDTELPGHVVHHGESTVLFGDGDGKIQTFDTEDFADGDPKPQVAEADEPHHGVAVKLADESMLHTIGTEDERVGAKVVDKAGKETARSEDCPGVHGEAAAKDDVIALGCEDGILLFKDGTFEKIDAPDSFGRIGNQSGHEDSQYILGDYKVEKDVELERPERVSVTDTKTNELSLVDLGASYSFRSLGRGPEGEGVVLTTDGKLKIIDPKTASVTEEYPVIDEWEEPVEWQEARPTLFVQDEVAYVSEPDKKKIHIVDLESGEVMAETTLPHAPNELTGVAG
ncbi:zinc metallochaperone AztD [Brevibacterium sp. JSBI002]|uniref:zinc metallochaperone AztD n=1 Tax=Brevibacterium sp. JSBI002 TaxID=2886045 RepID=UPI00222EFE6D|nr:zinc metallochaperone AztD [Brevibacterium sp. JSBI002]UZD61697.1 zinc metallochaperone AztD [Brevibacterium sp. JSBI002]